MDNDLWRVVAAELKDHNNHGHDPTPIHSLNRIFDKYVSCYKLGPVPWLSQNTCLIESQMYDQVQLGQLVRWHRDRYPNPPPAIVVEFKGGRYLVNGNHRVNYWLANESPQQAEVIIIRPTYLNP